MKKKKKKKNYTYTSLHLSKPVNIPSACCLGHSKFKTLGSPTVVRLLSAVTKAKTFVHSEATFRQKRVKEVKIFLQSKRPACPVGWLLKCTGQSSFKRLILATPLNFCLIRSMSVLGSDDPKDHNCKRGEVTQQPPIAFAQFKYKPWVTEPNGVKSSYQGVTNFNVT